MPPLLSSSSRVYHKVESQASIYVHLATAHDTAVHRPVFHDQGAMGAFLSSADHPEFLPFSLFEPDPEQ